MSPSDLVTSAFEVVGLWCLIGDCQVLYRDRAVKGIAVWPRGVYGSWALWNVCLFGSVGMPLSATIAALSVFAYCVWLAMAVRCRRVHADPIPPRL